MFLLYFMGFIFYLTEATSVTTPNAEETVVYNISEPTPPPPDPLQSMIIRNNSLAFSMWRRPTVHPLMKVHVFNYTNWDEVRYDPRKKLHVQDVGPYVYSQHIERMNVTFNDEKLTFQEKSNFVFQPEPSPGSAFDKIHVPNLPAIEIISRVRDMSAFVQLAISSALSMIANHKEAYLHVPVNKFLWGYDDDIIQITKPVMVMSSEEPPYLNYEKFGILNNRNDTTSNVFTINTGDSNISRINLLENIDGKEELSLWSSPACNSFDASYTTSFPPSLLDRKSTLYVFIPNLCRRMPFEYIKDVEIDGVTLLRYGIPLDVFDDFKNKPENKCYCDELGNCPLKGLLNVTRCTWAITRPISALVSLPHFLNADPILREKIDGLNPDPELHRSYLDIHPGLGVSVRGKVSYQLNIEVRKSSFFNKNQLDHLQDGLIMPIAWIEMTVPELPENLRSLIFNTNSTTATPESQSTV